MNVGDYGVQFVFGSSPALDLSSFSVLSLVFTRPNGTTLTVTTPDLSVPATPVTIGGVTYAANTYASYFFQDGDVTVPGVWKARLNYQNASPILLHSNYGSFLVGP